MKLIPVHRLKRDGGLDWLGRKPSNHVLIGVDILCMREPVLPPTALLYAILATNSGSWKTKRTNATAELPRSGNLSELQGAP